MKELLIEMCKEMAIPMKKVQAKALEALHLASEGYITRLLEDSYLIALHGRRVTLQVRDIHLAQRLRGELAEVRNDKNKRKPER